MHAPQVLADDAEVAIRTCLSNGTLVAGDREEAEVARLVLHLPSELVKAWQPSLAAGSLEVSGWFAHKTPKAKFTDPRTGKRRGPELCDLVVVVDVHEPAGTERRALMLQVKMADKGAAAGQFTVAAGDPDLQRCFYAHLPPFQLTGIPKHRRGPDFVITPAPLGTCKGTRYACVNTTAAAPASGWWVELGQAPVPASGIYSGTLHATVTLGEALRQVIEGSLGAHVVPGSQWERVVDHVMLVAKTREAKGDPPPDVVAKATASALPHSASASLFLSNGPSIFKVFDLFASVEWPELIDIRGSYAPPIGQEPVLDLHGRPPGFGVLHVQVSAARWRGEAPTKRTDAS